MRLSNAELLAEIDMLEDAKRVDASELELVKYIDKLEGGLMGVFVVSSVDSISIFKDKNKAFDFLRSESKKSKVTFIGFNDD